MSWCGIPTHDPSCRCASSIYDVSNEDLVRLCVEAILEGCVTNNARRAASILRERFDDGVYGEHNQTEDD